jgi:beta-lactam-binding protein with PASTA domain
MQGALSGQPNTHFTAPSDKTKRGEVKDLPALGGMNPDDAANKLRSMGFEAAIASGQVGSEETAGTVAYTSPRQAEGAPKGSMVTIYVSNGSKTRQPTKPPNTGQQGYPLPSCPPWHPRYPNCGTH